MGMTDIALKNVDTTEMRKFYEEELEKTIHRLEHIRKVLDQLGGDTVKLDINIVKSGNSNPRAAKPVAARTAKPARTGKKRGPKAIWESLVLKRLRQLDRPVTYEELTDEIMLFSKLPKEKQEKTKRAIVNVAFKLRNRDQKIDTFSTGKREKYIALRSWFDSSGEIKKEYRDKIKS